MASKKNESAVEIAPPAEILDYITDYLEEQGYQVTKNPKIRGKSGVEHLFAAVAEYDDGIANYKIALETSNESTKNDILNTIFSFANKTYDTGIRDKFLITTSVPEEEVIDFAQKQHIKIYDQNKLENLPNENKQVARKLDGAIRTKADLLRSLKELNYQVDENATIRGRSGTDYIFDILAYSNNGLLAHSLGIDLVSNNESVSLETISLFDTKAYDAGINYKLVFTDGKLTTSARSFAQSQNIKVIEAEKEESLPEETIEESNSEDDATTSLKTNSPLREKPQAEGLQMIPEVMARRYNAIPLSVTKDVMVLAMAKPTDIFALEAFAAQSHKRIKPVAVDPEELRLAIDTNYKAYSEIEEQLSRISISDETPDDKLAIGAASDAPLAHALDLIIEEAAKAHASDIHIEPEETRLRIRYRIDGTLHETMSLPPNIQRALVSRIKILAEMNIADHFRAQDGQFSVDSKGRPLDVRVATIPTVHGEMAVLRILDKSVASRGLAELGMLPETMEGYTKILKNPYGMILISGPTGSGKTTTLYASVNSLDIDSNNVITIEDPAEYRFNKINQIQVSTQANITFASGLRAIMRLDPDVILVGEIRDGETAKIATQSALTGHLVLSSVHANDSAGVFFRLMDLGVEQFLIASSIIGIVAQRMVRRVCPDCGKMIEAPVVEQLAYEKVTGEKRTKFLYGSGCEACSFTGYRGRRGLFEIINVTDELRMMLSNKASKVELVNKAIEQGMIPMIKDGMTKVKMGLTTPSEVIRATYTQE